MLRASLASPRPAEPGLITASKRNKPATAIAPPPALARSGQRLPVAAAARRKPATPAKAILVSASGSLRTLMSITASGTAQIASQHAAQATNGGRTKTVVSTARTVIGIAIIALSHLTADLLYRCTAALAGQLPATATTAAPSGKARLTRSTYRDPHDCGHPNYHAA